ncbi:hypothetical protein CPB84DRAFT_773692 [Gymnopilus junonius]|uniref:F-box domain-containing protein n=1 Tax=Gymnopilus junonius TaxID=109634 RepID=A0A9P5TQG6_GYMJU|nr:hypothetical protein CPB84DRAFT_773692 [Gymnopilus junonius]
MSISIAPIYKLKHDILYHIFTLNADIFDRRDCRLPHDSPLRALTTTRYSSQVCREWRSIILGSSTLWARLLDLDLLQQEEGDWRDEILRRSGETHPLWIRNTRKAMMDEMPLGLETFLLRLLDEYWDRVQKVDIFVEDWANLAARCDQLCLRPAPAFKISLLKCRHTAANPLPPRLPPFYHSLLTMRHQ